ncbi:DNA polymerase Y family protein [Agarivorans aestuarii]|uniref:DNA polymerase Y family protein n=1 Tax=Agarivorans aestuarii TaxID=1563703 RepID=A0ABU7G288_9ALTE|nr:DNA polymerase Y family protein [Agarivorans aestuarii]MEE1673084.1 DNA polymerase Y family protein [Agarivorans aestuarii]
MYWIYLDFPQLALDLLQREQPSQQALAIHHNKQIIQLNQVAHHLGVYLGCSLNTAYQLAPQLCLYQQSDLSCDAYFDALAQQALHYSAQVAVHPDKGLYISGAGMRNIYPKPEQHITKLVTHYQHQQLSFRIAHAPSAMAARWLARSQDIKQVNSGIKFLADLPLSASDLPSSLVTSLQAMGLYTLKQLSKLPRPELRKRLGEDSLHLLDQANGQQSTPLTFIKPQARYQQAFPLLAETHTIQGLMFSLKQACQHLQQWLRQRQFCSNILVLTLNFRNKPCEIITVKSARLLQTSHDWLALFRLKLESIRLSAAVIEFSLDCQALYPLGHELSGLFEQQQSACDNLLFDQLSVRLGEHAISRLSCQADFRPEYASQYRPLSQHEALSYPKQFARPCWLLPQLKPINIQHYTLLSEPERIASGWWDEQSVNRDYYMAQSPDQGLAWVCQENRQWYLHGWFA